MFFVFLFFLRCYLFDREGESEREQEQGEGQRERQVPAEWGA